MPLAFNFPEGPRLRRLAASLATPARRTGPANSLSQRTYAFFLAFPWTGRSETGRVPQNLKSSSVGRWFEQFPWNGTLMTTDHESRESILASLANGENADTQKLVPAGAQGETDTSSFFDAFFGDDDK